MGDMTDTQIRQLFEDLHWRIISLEQQHDPSTWLRNQGYSHLTPDVQTVPVKEPRPIPQQLKADFNTLSRKLFKHFKEHKDSYKKKHRY